MHKFTRILLSLSLLAMIVSACQPAPATPDMNVALTQAFGTAFAQLQPTQSPIPTETPIPSPTAIRTPPALPGTFTTDKLNALDVPHTYVQDTCQYLQDKWNSNNAAPGTVVMVIMLHGIKREQADVTANDITAADFRKLMDDLKEQGFEAINATQMADFIDHNANIPMRSALIIQDDRRTGENFNDHFRKYHDQWGWPVVNAWISFEDGPRALSLADNVALEAEGWVDHQSH